MVARLCLLQLVVSLTVSSTALENRNQATKEKELLQLKNSKFTLDENTVSNFPIYRDGITKHINIAKEIGTNRSEDFGIELLGPEKLTEIDNIIEKKPQSANIRIITQWFEGQTENQVTCKFLVDVLKRIGHIDLANDVKTTCKHFNVLDEPYRPRTLNRYSQQLAEKYEKEPIIETTLFLPKSLREHVIEYVPLEMEEKGVNITLGEIFDNIQIGTRVLFLGRPGVGKTIVTRHITKLLLRNGRFHLVVRIHLGTVKEIDSLKELLRINADESFKPDNIQRILNYIENTVGKDVCFLLDGYDEYYGSSGYINGLLKGIYLKKSIVILTSRPSAVKDIKDDFDRKVEIIGFGDASVQTYLKQLQLPDAKYDIISHYLSTHPNVRQLCSVPLHLSMLVYVADGEDDNKLSVGDTETQLYLDFLYLTIRQYQEVRFFNQTVDNFKECLHDVHKKAELCIIFRIIFQVSFEGLMLRKTSFNSTSFTGLPDSSNITTKLEQLSLFKVVPVHDRRGFGLYKFYYSHPTFQEFFAAFHLTTLPRNEQLKYIRNSWMLEMYKFFLGLIGTENYDSEYRSLTFVSFSWEVLSTYTTKNALYIMKCSHETGRSTHFVPLLKAVGVLTGTNSVNLNVYTFDGHDCWYIGYALLMQSSFYKLTVDASSNQFAFCISFITNYLKHQKREMLDRVNVEKLVLGFDTFLPTHITKQDSPIVRIFMNFLPVFQKHLKHLELNFMAFGDNESVLRLGDTLKSFKNLSFLALSVHVNIIINGSLEIALKKLSSLNHLQLRVINRYRTPIPQNLLEFRHLTNVKSLSLVLSWSNELVNANMTSLVGGLEYMTNLQSLRLRIALDGIYGATEMLHGINQPRTQSLFSVLRLWLGIKRLSISKLALELILCGYHGLGNVSVKELTRVLSNMTILSNLSLCIDFKSSGVHGNTGVTALSKALKSLVDLQQLQLTLSSSQIDAIDEGAEAIANALKQLHCLKVLKLKLKLNGGINKIVSLFPFLPQLQELKLCWRHIHNKTNASIVLNGIKHLKQLKKLDLSWNEIGDQDVTSLVDALKNSNVSTLDLSHNQIGDIGMEILANATESGYLSSLQVLILDLNAFSDTGAEILSQKVVNLSKLRTFNLGTERGKYRAWAMTQIYQSRRNQKSQMKQHNESYIPDIRTQVLAFEYKFVAALVLGAGMPLIVVALARGKLGSDSSRWHSQYSQLDSETTDIFDLVKASNALRNALTVCSASLRWELRSSVDNNLDGRGTVIAILDSAIDCQYPAFQRHVQLGTISPIDEIIPPLPVNSTAHGTLCTAVAIGSSVDERVYGISLPEGVAPGASCIVYRVAENDRCCSEAILRALEDIERKIQNGIQIDVVSISLDITERQNEIEEKILRLTERKVVFVAAAGNSGYYAHQPRFPARLDCVISVGALDRFGRQSKFTNRGRIDVFAPGEGIRLGHEQCSGTSYASPAIGGLVLLLKQHAKAIETLAIGLPACDHIHRVEILKKIFAEDMVFTSKGSKRDKIFAPGDFLKHIASRPSELNEIVERHLNENERPMEIE